MCGAKIYLLAFAKKYFAGRDAVGRWVLPINPEGSAQPNTDARTIVGVVADVRDWSVEAPPQPQLYSPLRDPSDAYIVIQSVIPRNDVLESAAAILHRIDASLAFSQVHSMRELVSEATARRRFQTVLLTIFCWSGVGISFGGVLRTSHVFGHTAQL